MTADYRGRVTKWRDESVEEIEPENPPFDMGYNQCLLDCADELAEVIACNAQPSPDSGGKPMNDDQIKYMVGRFLTWRLPENFRPDAGISFIPNFNEHTAYPMKHEPVGTNLFDATQAEEMIRYMVNRMPIAEARPVQQPATEPDKFVMWVREDISEVDWLRQKLNEEVKYGIAADKKIEKLKAALALRDVPQGPDDREIVAEWRSCLCAAWASGHRAVMTMLLERGPSYPARQVPVGPEGKK